MAESMGRLLSPEAVEQAVGAPGTPGDSVAIEHLGRRLILNYEGMLDWAAEFRAVHAPDVLQEAFSIAPHAADRPLREIRQFIDGAVTQCDRIPAHIANAGPEKPPLSFVLELYLTTDDAVFQAFHKALKRAERRLKWGF